MKTRTLGILFGVGIILLGASCSKQAEPSPASAAPAGVPAAAVKKDSRPKAAITDNLTPENIFSLSREGEKVTIAIKLNFSPTCKAIMILRNTTGMASSQIPAAHFRPEIEKFEDTVPDTKAYWYWVRVTPKVGASKNYGPIRSNPDTDNSGKYTAASPLPWTVTRKETTATVTWDFTDPVKSVMIRRASDQSTRNRTTSVDTKKGKDTYEDKLPDPNADYWYWIEARLQTGVVVSEGPRKAEFAGNQ